MIQSLTICLFPLRAQTSEPLHNLTFTLAKDAFLFFSQAGGRHFNTTKGADLITTCSGWGGTSKTFSPRLIYWERGVGVSFLPRWDVAYLAESPGGVFPTSATFLLCFAVSRSHRTSAHAAICPFPSHLDTQGTLQPLSLVSPADAQMLESHKRLWSSGTNHMGIVEGKGDDIWLSSGTKPAL